MPADSLNQLQTVPPGIESVTNPLPATGGVGPEKLARARQNAPLTVRAMGRIVSLVDYEDFVRVFAGIGKAQARLLHAGHHSVLQITLADGEGQPIPKTSDLYRKLVQAIDENRGTPQPQVRVDSYEPVYFDLRARLLIDPDHRERQRDIEAAVRSKISRSFAFDARGFGQDVSASEVISLVQDTPGVVAVQLVHLYRSTQGASLSAVLQASLARWHEGRLLPAQMLLVNARGGITLDMEVAV
jgi:predicted phage baseplate assembly protein